MSTARRRATYEDLCAVPEHLVAEIIDGAPLTSPRPAPRHAVAHSATLGQLHGAFGGPPEESGPGGWWILLEPELRLGDDVLVPDVAGRRRERMPTIPDAGVFRLALDWVCEATSPALEVFRFDGSHWIVDASHAGNAPVRVVPVDAVAVDARRWWADA